MAFKEHFSRAEQDNRDYDGITASGHGFGGKTQQNNNTANKMWEQSMGDFAAAYAATQSTISSLSGEQASATAQVAAAIPTLQQTLNNIKA